LLSVFPHLLKKRRKRKKKKGEEEEEKQMEIEIDKRYPPSTSSLSFIID
jgi:hypothetical protein